MRGIEEFMHGFDAGEQRLLTPPVRIEAETRERMVKVLAAIVLGSTPEEVAGYLEAGFPPEVDGMLARPLEVEEMNGHLDQLLAAMQTTATVVA